MAKEIKSGFDGGGKNISSSEAAMMRKVRHKNIVRYIDSFTNGNYLYLIMEKCDRGDLRDYINRLASDMQIGEIRLWKFLLQILSALHYIHKQKIVHGDMKPQNILLHGKDYEVKLADFGISQAISSQTFLFDQVGSIPYCSPEIFQGEPYN